MTKTNSELVDLFHRLAAIRQEQRKRRDILLAAEERTSRLKAQNREGRAMAEWKPRAPLAKPVPLKD
jgi:hypothetical protein